MSVFTNPASSSREQAEEYIAAILGLLGEREPLAVLQATEDALRERVSGLTVHELTRPEAPGKWSVRHVLQHLADSEAVWSFRLRLVLSQHRPTLTGYDQDAFAERLGYDDVSADNALKTFSVLRGDNLRLLLRASPADLQRIGLHAERGEESVAHMMKLYAGHDILHLNQIDRILRAAS